MRDEDDLAGGAAVIALTLLAPKRAYVSPLVITEALFTAAAGCGKAQPNSFTCRQVPRTS